MNRALRELIAALDRGKTLKIFNDGVVMQWGPKKTPMTTLLSSERWTELKRQANADEARRDTSPPPASVLDKNGIVWFLRDKVFTPLAERINPYPNFDELNMIAESIIGMATPAPATKLDIDSSKLIDTIAETFRSATIYAEADYVTLAENALEAGMPLGWRNYEPGEHVSYTDLFGQTSTFVAQEDGTLKPVDAVSETEDPKTMSSSGDSLTFTHTTSHGAPSSESADPAPEEVKVTGRVVGCSEWVPEPLDKAKLQETVTGETDGIQCPSCQVISRADAWGVWGPKDPYVTCPICKDKFSPGDPRLIDVRVKMVSDPAAGHRARKVVESIAESYDRAHNPIDYAVGILQERKMRFPRMLGFAESARMYYEQCQREQAAASYAHAPGEETVTLTKTFRASPLRVGERLVPRGTSLAGSKEEREAWAAARNQLNVVTVGEVGGKATLTNPINGKVTRVGPAGYTYPVDVIFEELERP